MKRVLIFLMLAVTILAAAGGYSEISVPRFQNGAMTLDGIPNEKIWDKAVKLTDFKVWKTQRKSDADTTVMMYLDRDNLYFGLVCKEPQKITESADSVWTSDNVEVFFGNLGETQWYRQIVFSPEKKRYNEFIENHQYELTTHVDKGRWSAEMIIPLKHLGKMPGDTFRFNMMRYRRNARDKRTTIADIVWAHDIDRYLTMRIYTPADEVTHGPWTFGVTADFAGVNWETSGAMAANLFVRKAGEKAFRKVPADVFASAQQNNRKLHSVYLKNLAPDTVYEYHVGDEKIKSFRTLSKERGDFTFAMTSDIHCHNAELVNVLRNKKVGKADFLLLNGDISTAFIGRQMCYDGYLDTILANWQKPFYMIRGNHEYRGGAIADFFDLFAPHTGKSYFSMCHKGVFFIVLDTDGDAPYTDSSYMDGQTAWLKSVVESKEFKEADFRILISHVPFFRSSQFEPLMKSIPEKAKNAFDLMLHGHVHCYCKVMPDSGKIISANPRYSNQKFSFKVPCPVLTNDVAGSIVVKKTNEKLTVQVMDNGGKTLDSLQIKRRQ